MVMVAEFCYTVSMIDMEQRISHLDTIMAELAHAQLRTEMGFKEMQRQSQQQAERMDQLGVRMDQLGVRMDQLGVRMDQTVERMEQDTRQMKKAWGDLANKLGTVAEDIVAPNIPRLGMEEFGFSAVEDIMVRAQRTSRRGPKRQAEWDVICSSPEKVVVTEVKSTPSAEYINAVPARLNEFFDFFPEYEGRELIGVFASWSIPAALLPVISAAGLYGIAMGDSTMDVVARPAPLMDGATDKSDGQV
jgi:hypothetical protein